MAIRLIEEYPNRVGAPTADYPHGVPRNKSTPTATDGTPFEQSWFRDQEGFFQGLMETAGITPSGQPDTVLNSDYLDALNRVTNGVIEVDMAGAADVSLSAYQGRVAALKLTGALAADVDLIVPDTERMYWIIDETTGDFSVTVKTAAGTGVKLFGESSAVRSDGTNVVSFVNGLDRRVIYVGSVAELEGLSLPAGTNVDLTEEGRFGSGTIKSGTHPADLNKGKYIDIANGNYWERSIEGEVLVGWWQPDYTSSDLSQLFDFIFSESQGKTVVFDSDKTINILPSVSKVKILGNTKVMTNGCRFVVNEAMTGANYGVAADYAVQVDGDNINIDRLVVDSTGTAPSFTIHAQGNNLNIGALESSNDIEDTDGGGGIFIGTNTSDTSKFTNLTVGSIKTVNQTGGVSIKRYDNIDIGFVSIEKFRRGLFVESSSNGVFHKGVIKGRAAYVTTPEAGVDGILIQTFDGDKVTHDLSFFDFYVEGAGEHGLYISGSDIQSCENIFFTNCTAQNCGSDGFKARAAQDNGGTASPNRHINIRFTNCTVIDAGGLGGTRSAFNIHGCTNSSLTNPVVYALFQTFSCKTGIAIRGSQKINIVGPEIIDAEDSGISSLQSGANYLGETSGINISGGRITNSKTAVHLQPSADRPIRNFTIDGLACYSIQENDFLSDTATFSGTYINNSCSASFSTSQCVVANFSGDFSNWLFTVRGLSSPGGIGAVPDGSTFADLRTGTLQVRKGGAWVSL